MKNYISGPGGDKEVKKPLSVWLADSSWFLTLCTLVFVAWAGYYLVLADPAVMTGRELSFAHRHLSHNCQACHNLFFGIPNESCQSEKCHGPQLQNTIHSSLSRSCASCHPEHAEAGNINTKIDNRECELCHQALSRDPNSPFFSGRPPRLVTNVASSVFKHSTHRDRSRYRKKYGKQCYVCHCLDLPDANPDREIKPINIPGEDLFKMSSCLVCHREEKSGCEVCHRYGSYSRPLGSPRARFYHQVRSPRFIVPPCISNLDLMSSLKDKTEMICTPERELMPGFINQNLCEDEDLSRLGPPAIFYGEFGEETQTPPEE